LALLASAVISIPLSATITLHRYLPLRFLSLHKLQTHNVMYMKCHYTNYFTYLSILTCALGSLCMSCCRGGTGGIPLKEAEHKESTQHETTTLTLMKEPSVCVCVCAYLFSPRTEAEIPSTQRSSSDCCQQRLLQR
jgi:hypothetical protein